MVNISNNKPGQRDTLLGNPRKRGRNHKAHWKEWVKL
jgi:hypothetical protein